MAVRARISGDDSRKTRVRQLTVGAAVTRACNVLAAAARIGGRVRGLVLALLTLLAFASVHQVAHAQALGSASRAKPMAQCGGDLELGSAPEEREDWRWARDSSQVRELAEFASEDTEQDSELERLRVDLTVRIAPASLSDIPEPPIRFAVWRARFWASSALPRGPPPVMTR
jgi:hypothetical protein